MTLDPQALTAAAEAEARYDGYDDLLSFSKTTRERYIDRVDAAIRAYIETAFPPRMVKLTPEDERLLEKALLASTDVLYPILPADAGWQDISTAPKEGDHVLLFASQKGEGSDVHWNGTFVTSGYWDGVDEAWCATGSNWTGPFLEPTHWQPLPPPPVGSGRNLADANSKSPIQAREE